MNRLTRLTTTFLIPLVLLAGCAKQDLENKESTTDEVLPPAEKLGTVVLDHSCEGAVDDVLDRGLALLHHMTYEDAREAFASAAAADPECAVAYWGQAMTFIHPLWSDPPSTESFRRGAALVEQARSIESKSDLESAMVEAVGAYYGTESDNERPRLAAFERAWASAFEKFPDDTEVKAFYALALLATADPTDKTYAVQRKTGRLAEEVLAAVPDHPGGHHYVIHSYDYPPLAEKALPVAHSYGDIAPTIAHALHMTSHIFTRTGLWDESIAFNRRSADAAKSHHTPQAMSHHYLHALDYLVYAYLQRGENSKAKAVQAELQAMPHDARPHPASAYTLAAVPARIALENHQWEIAAAIAPRTPRTYPWDDAPQFESISHFASAIGAARSGNIELARAHVEHLAALRDKTTHPYWSGQVEIQRVSALAWLELAEGDDERALATAIAAAKMEASTDKHPVTPGEVLPAHELLGEMLLEADRPAEALEAFQGSLERSPNRLNSLLGAARAAKDAGLPQEAAAYYRKIVEMTATADSERPEIAEAQAFVAGA